MKVLSLCLALAFALGCSRSGSTEKNRTTYDEYVAGYDQQFEDLEKEYEGKFEQLELEKAEAQKAFIKDHPDSLRSISLLYEADWSFESTEEYLKYIRMIDPSLQDNEDYIRLLRITEQAEKVQVGKIAPDFTMTDSKGMPHTLSNACGSSEYLLLDFWASNCGPCRQQNPYILKAYNKYHPAGFDVFGVSTDTDRKSWLSAIEQDGLPWTNVCSFDQWNDHPVVLTYALNQVSQNFLLDRNGRIIARDLRGEELIETLDGLFN